MFSVLSANSVEHFSAAPPPRDYNHFKSQEMPAMTKRLTLGAALLLLSLSVAKLLFAQGAAPSASQAKTALTGEDRDRLLAAGKKLFMERCAKCHDERGDKPLKTGLPLSQRELSAEQLARVVSGRLQNSPDEDKRAVTLYISTLLPKK
jgi:mono/diheme cytochrome c family protein